MGRDDRVDADKRATLRRFATVGATAPFVGAGSAAAETGESEVRDAISGYLTTTPGAHFSKIRDDLKLGTGEAQHHLRTLEEAGRVEQYRDGDYRRFVAAGRFDDFEKTALGYLRRETPRGMIIQLLREPAVSARELAENLDVSAPTVSKYAASLEEAQLLTREDGYALVRPESQLVLLTRHADSFGSDAVSLAGEADSLVSYTG
ncbi:winged helix-turn-helix transcriptional regulator [Halovivax gelatinilyticus]|uniref:winged helix-turn-helix transcriptional regulator n=1 Tax=Halovivax gelatinilyticus TaxID=2961597 RepID=UPI0020CA2C56|nr:winged helix-turn-helix transcriptional regulator [Halovivax gelatinilyticus]